MTSRSDSQARGAGGAPRSTRALVRAVACSCAWAVLAGSGSGCGDADPRPATWGYISPAILQPNCATTSCHGPAAAVSGLDFSTPERGYASLSSLWVWIPVPPDAGVPPAGVPCSTVDGTLVCEERIRPLVTPYDPANSRLVNMLRARDAPRMPPDRPLTEPDIRLIERWISNGACEMGFSCDGGAGGSGGTGAGSAVSDGGPGN